MSAFLRLPEVLKTKYPRSRSSTYADIDAGLFPPGIRVSQKRVCWLDEEIDALIAARAAGVTDAKVRALVADLVAARGHADAPARRSAALRGALT
jgi:prophage regulatory protein